MTFPRESHTATLLSSGKVLIAGGSDGTLGYTMNTTLYASSETFDPSTGQFTAAGMMTTQRDWYTASLLASGKVLAGGGDGSTQTNASADLFDPSNGSFAATGNMTEPRFYHDASTLNDGTVLNQRRLGQRHQGQGHRRDLRPHYCHLYSHRQHELSARLAHFDAASEWQGADHWRIR